MGDASGSTSVYILKKQNGKQVLIKSMGAVRKESGIIQLENIAREKLEKLSKQTFNYLKDEQLRRANL